MRTIEQRFAAPSGGIWGQLSVGGSSAGLAVQGRRAFRGPIHENTSSRVVLDRNNVRDAASFRHYVNFTDDFLDLGLNSGIARVVTETHFKERNRMARFVAFLSQSQAEVDADAGLAARISFNGRMRGIAADEGTALIVDVGTQRGIVRTTQRGPGQLAGYVFFAQAQAQVGAGVDFSNGVLETTRAVSLWRLGDRMSFDLANWQSLQRLPQDATYTVQIRAGRAEAASDNPNRPRLPEDLYVTDIQQRTLLRDLQRFRGEDTP